MKAVHTHTHTLNSYARDLRTSSSNCSGRLLYLFSAFSPSTRSILPCNFPRCRSRINYFISIQVYYVQQNHIRKSEHIFHAIVVPTCLPSNECLATAALVVDAWQLPNTRFCAFTVRSSNAHKRSAFLSMKLQRFPYIPHVCMLHAYLNWLAVMVAALTHPNQILSIFKAIFSITGTKLTLSPRWCARTFCGLTSMSIQNTQLILQPNIHTDRYFRIHHTVYQFEHIR